MLQLRGHREYHDSRRIYGEHARSRDPEGVAKGDQNGGRSNRTRPPTRTEREKSTLYLNRIRTSWWIINCGGNSQSWSKPSVPQPHPRNKECEMPAVCIHTRTREMSCLRTNLFKMLPEGPLFVLLQNQTGKLRYSPTTTTTAKATRVQTECARAEQETRGNGTRPQIWQNV